MNQHKMALLYNDSAGSGAMNLDEVTEMLGPNISVVRCAITETVESISHRLMPQNVTGVIAFGGDGTVNVAAQLALMFSVPLGIIPGGTHNHFAKDVGLPLDSKDAVRVIVSGKTGAVDVARVNGKLFLNTSSVGVYPKAARKKDVLRSSLGRHLAAAIALIYSFFRITGRNYIVEYDDSVLRVASPSIFVGNNEYGFNKGSPITRTRLDGGTLFVHVIASEKLYDILALAYAVIRKKPRSAHEYRFTAKHLKISTRAKRIMVATDGETQHMDTPLFYEILPAALQVFCPPS